MDRLAACAPPETSWACSALGTIHNRLRMKLRLSAFIFVFASAAFAQTAAQNSAIAKHPFTFEDMMALKRLGEPVPSPDGKWVVFAAEDVDLEANTKISHLWIVPATGGESHRLNETPNHEERPRFSPDGRRLIWTSKATDPTQIWMCDFDSDSGVLKTKPHQVTDISTGADGGIWSPDGKNIVFISAVYPDCNPPPPGSGAASADDCNKQRDEELKKSKVKAKIFTRLFYRHWNAFTEFKRSHLFVQSADATVSSTDILSVGPAGLPPAESGTAGKMPAGPIGQRPVLHHEPRDLTPGDHDVPPFHLGGQDMYAISPDGQELAYTCNIESEAGPAFVEATSTNSEIFIVPMNVESASSRLSSSSQAGSLSHRISTSPGSDSTPIYSPDGKYIAWRSQARAGFEADKWRLLVQDRQSGQTRDLTDKFDHSVGSFTSWDKGWDKDVGNIRLFFSAEDHGESPLFGVVNEGEPQKIVDLHADDLIFSNGTLFFSRASITSPTEIWRAHVPQIDERFQPSQVTHMNDVLLSQIDTHPLESFTFKGANDEEVQGFLVKPPGFDPGKKYPLKFLIHGGPQGAWGNSWTYRWNAELFAASGYVVVMINFHGSTGYGQKFTDSISGDWGGKPYVDLMRGLDYVEKTYPFIDKDREAA